jgi:predicted phosphodiesterase
MVELGGAWIYLLHDLGDLDIDPAAAGVRVVMSGHSHQPIAFEEEGVLYVNPGSAGPKRFTLPISIGYLDIGAGRIDAELRTLI